MATDAQHHRNQTAIVQADRVIAQLDETIETSRRRSAEIVASLRSAVAHEHDKEAWILYTFAAIAGAALGVAMGLWL